MPDLQKLLGASYQTYTTAVAAENHPGLKRPLRIATSDLVVESDGHMRAYSGRAYLPALIPAGTAAERASGDEALALAVRMNGRTAKRSAARRSM